MIAESVNIPVDNAQLAATLQRNPDVRPSAHVVVINSAMGMPRQFYAPFAQFLADQGIDTLSWDYRGTGDSRGSNEDVHIHDWGERDLPAVIGWMRSRYPERRLAIVAHSVGGQILGMTPQTNRAHSLVLIASQSGYWRLWSGRQQLRIALLWYLVIPVFSRLFKRFPGHWFGLDIDLPKGVLRQWAQWGRDPDYLMGQHRRPSASNYVRIDRPLLNVWISDDEIASFAANREMLSWYPNAQIEHWDIEPRELGVERVGHFRLFRETVGPRFWPRLVEWIVSKDHA